MEGNMGKFSLDIVSLETSIELLHAKIDMINTSLNDHEETLMAYDNKLDWLQDKALEVMRSINSMQKEIDQLQGQHK